MFCNINVTKSSAFDVEVQRDRLVVEFKIFVEKKVIMFVNYPIFNIIVIATHNSHSHCDGIQRPMPCTSVNRRNVGEGLDVIFAVGVKNGWGVDVLVLHHGRCRYLDLFWGCLSMDLFQVGPL
jgi:hypothetical protein